MTSPEPRVWVVDDEPNVRDAVTLLLRAADYDARPCTSGPELLHQIDPDIPGCILLDLRMPEMNGFEVQRELARRGLPQPVVFLSGHGDIPIAVQAVHEGAVDFLEKPVRDTQLIAAVERALAEDGRRRVDQAARRAARELLDALSPREAEVADLLLEGLRTPEIADRLGLSPRTVEMHRTRLLKRVGARTTAEAASIIERARDLVEAR